MKQTTAMPKKKPMPTDVLARLGLSLPAKSPGKFGGGGIATKAIEMWDRYVSHPGTGIDPRDVIEIYRRAEIGDPMMQCDLFQDITETDGHLRSTIGDRLLAVSGKDWEIMAGGDKPLDLTAAEVLRDQITEANFDEALGAILAARFYGYSGTEIDWQRRDGDIVPNWFVPVPFRRFRFDELGRPLFLNSDLYDGELLKPGRWIWGSNASIMDGPNPRSGLLRSAVFFSLFKKWSWRDWVIYAEKFGIPLVIGKHDPDATEEEKEQMEETVADVGEAGQCTMSSNMEIDIRESQRAGGSGGLHESIVKEANNEISRLITGSLSGDGGGTGSYKHAAVNQSRAFNVIMSDAKKAAETFKHYIAKPWQHYNGLQAAKLPILKIHVAKEVDPTARVNILAKLQEMGLDLDSEQVRGEFQIRKPPSDERKLERIVLSSPSSDGEADDGSADDESEESESEE